MPFLTTVFFCWSQFMMLLLVFGLPVDSCCSRANQGEWLLWSKQSTIEMKVLFSGVAGKTRKVRKTLERKRKKERERQTRRQKSLLISFVKQSCYSHCQLMPVVSKMVNAFCHRMKLFSLWFCRGRLFCCLFFYPCLNRQRRSTLILVFFSIFLHFALISVLIPFYSWKRERRGEQRKEKKKREENYDAWRFRFTSCSSLLKTSLSSSCSCLVLSFCAVATKRAFDKRDRIK